jgi:hypothetical protein
MNPRFKPFLTPPAEGTEQPRPFQLKVMSAGTTAAPFKPLSSVLSAVKSGRGNADVPPEIEDEVEPKLETKRQGDQISRITVTCNCGRTHEIECEY